MSKGGIGIGSASIILVFAVLCLAIFSLISLSVANGDQALVAAETDMVEAYYEADSLAEQVLDLIVKAWPFVDNNYLGVNISTSWQGGGEYATVEFVCAISSRKELTVEVMFTDDGYTVRRWKMQDAVVWTFDPSTPIWQGNSFWVGGS